MSEVKHGTSQRLPLLQFEDRPGILDLSWGHPQAALLPVGPWASATQQMFTCFGWQALTYGYAAGWINASAGLVRRLCRLGYIDSGGGVNHSTALAMAAFGASGAYGQHIAGPRRAYQARRDALVAALRSALPGAEVQSPAGGWFVWLRLPDGQTATGLLPTAEQHGVSFASGPQFYPDARGGEQYIRLAFSFLTPAQLAEAAARLATAVTDDATRR